ncbi:MAG TPA: histidine kinase [Trebonia sp.]
MLRFPSAGKAALLVARARFGERQRLACGVLVAYAGLAVITAAVVPYAADTTGPSAHGEGQRLLLVLLACGPVALLRRWALPALAVIVVAAGLVMAAGVASLAVGAVLGLTMCLAAFRLPRRQSMPVGVVAALVLGAALVHVTLASPKSQLSVEAVEGFLPLAAGWLAGDTWAARRRYVAGLAEQAEREQDAAAEHARQEVRDERMRIAAELHDVVAHSLAVITVQAGVGRRLMARDPEEAGSALESIEAIGRRAQDELRVVLGLLRSEGDAAAERSPAPKLADLRDLAETVRQSGTPVKLRMPGSAGSLSPALEVTVYRVVQEALTNVVKHAPGACAAVDVTVDAGKVHVEITDDGGPPGAPREPGRIATGHGIAGMRERVSAFGGWLSAGPRQGHGFRVVAEIPARDPA